MTNNGTNHDHERGEALPGLAFELEEPITLKGFAATYDRKFNLGNFESLNPAMTIWVKTAVPEGAAFDLHHARERVRLMARENVRAQLLRQQGSAEVVFLGLQPPHAGTPDPIFVRTVSVSLVYRVNLGNYQSIAPGYTDWADLRHVAHSPGELHMALTRIWQSLWANLEDEIARARGEGGTGGFLGLPQIVVEDLRPPAANGPQTAVPSAGVPRPNGQSRTAVHGSRG
jgi:hypothetical protein